MKENNMFEIDYSKEEINDEILVEIRKLTSMYLLEGVLPSNLKIENLFLTIEFLEDKFNEMMDLKEGLKLPNYDNKFVEISKNLDNLTLSENILGTQNNYILTLLAKDIESVLSEMALLYSIVEKMIIEMNVGELDDN